MAAPLARAAIAFSQASPGNIFSANEAVGIPLACDGDRLECTVTDFSGATVRQWSVVPSAGGAVLLPELGRRGYFDLRVVEKCGAAVLSEKTTSFAVLAPIDVAALADSPFGVQTHGAQGGSPAAYGLLARAGIAHFRDEHYWSCVEPAPLAYQYPKTFEAFMAAAAAAGLQPPLMTLDWANPSYDYSQGMFTAPYTESGRLGYANYGAELVRHYPALKYVEVWNEYNAGTFIAGPATTAKPSYYKLMLEQACLRIKAARPDVKIVAGATVPVAHGFLRDVFAQGAMPFLDVVSVHPYRTTPAGVETEIAELRELIKRNNGGVEKPIWATEFSREVKNAAEQGEAATYLAQICTLLLSQRVERMYYYVALDDASFPYRGLLGSPNDVRGAFTPHPAYVAYANLSRQLNGCSYQSRFAGTASSTYAFRFQRGADRVNVLWAEKPITVTLQTSSSVVVTDIMGEAKVLAPVDGLIRLTLGRNPQYVEGPVDAVIEFDNPLLADSASGYGAMQGGFGWTYGYVAQASTAVYDPTRFTAMRWDYCGSDAVCWLTGRYHFISVEQMHPSSNWAVRRWTSSVAATVSLSGRVSRGKNGDGVNVGIYVDGRRVYGKFLPPGSSEDYVVDDVAIAVGSKVDFTVNQAGENSFDSTLFTAQVTRR